MRWLGLTLLLLTGCAGVVRYQVVETAYLADERRVVSGGVLTCKGMDNTLDLKCMVECERRIGELNRVDKMDAKRDGPNVLVLGRTIRVCKRID